MYEYLALRRPILAIGPMDGDFTNIIKETNSGVVHSFQDVAGIKNSIENYNQLFNAGKLKVSSISYEKYSRKNLAQKIIGLTENAN